MHYTANDGDTDEANGNVFHNNKIGASAHYFVDDDSITLSVEEHRIAYSVGGAKWNDVNVTGGGKLYGKAYNSNTINIEMCDTVRDGKYGVSDKTKKNTMDLVVHLMMKYQIDIDHVIRHFDVNGKHCPSYLMSDSAWNKFKGEIMMNFGETCYNAIQEYLKSKPLNTDAKTQSEFDDAVAKGITDGTRPCQTATRWQVAVMIVRAIKLVTKK